MDSQRSLTDCGRQRPADGGTSLSPTPGYFLRRFRRSRRFLEPILRRRLDLAISVLALLRDQPGLVACFHASFTGCLLRSQPPAVQAGDCTRYPPIAQAARLLIHHRTALVQSRPNRPGRVRVPLGGVRTLRRLTNVSIRDVHEYASARCSSGMVHSQRQRGHGRLCYYQRVWRRPIWTSNCLLGMHKRIHGDESQLGWRPSRWLSRSLGCCLYATARRWV